jgi:hypothetical protein
MLHALQQRANAARPFVGHRTMALQRESELLVLGADPELRFGFDALREPMHQIVAPLDRRQVDLITRHIDNKPAWDRPQPDTRRIRLRNATPWSYATALRFAGAKRP